MKNFPYFSLIVQICTFLQFPSKKREKFCQYLSKRNLLTIFIYKGKILTTIPPKSANLDNFPFLKVKNRGKLFHNFVAHWGNIIFWAEYSMLISDHFLLLLFPITSLRLTKLYLISLVSFL